MAVLTLQINVVIHYVVLRGYQRRQSPFVFIKSFFLKFYSLLERSKPTFQNDLLEHMWVGGLETQKVLHSLLALAGYIEIVLFHALHFPM